MAFYPRRWTRQPQAAVDLADWLPAETLAYVGGRSSLVGLSANAQVGTVNATSTQGGLAARTGTTSSYINAGLVPQALVGASWLTQFVRLDSAARYLSGTVDTGTNYIEAIGVNLAADDTTSAGKLQFALRGDGGSQRYAATAAAPLEIGKVHTVCIRLVSGTAYEIWVDGVSQSVTYNSTGTVGQTAGTTDFPLALLNRNLRGAFSGGTGIDLLLYLRTPMLLPNPAELTASMSAPWQVFAPRRIWVPQAAITGLPTLSLPTYTPGSLTATGFRPRVTAT